MVEAVRGGQSQHEVARAFHVSPSTVNRWVRHAHGRRLDRVDWSDRSRVPHATQRTAATIEDLVLDVRRQLRHESDLGFYGAEAIRDALASRGITPLPAPRKINHILHRRGVLDGQGRVRRPPPPRGRSFWHSPTNGYDCFSDVQYLRRARPACRKRSPGPALCEPRRNP